MLHNALISLRPIFALMFLAFLFYLRVLYVRRQRRKVGLPDVPFRMFGNGKGIERPGDPADFRRHDLQSLKSPFQHQPKSRTPVVIILYTKLQKAAISTAHSSASIRAA